MLLGLHHVTAIAGDPQRNLDFFTGFLGLRLVKRTVNFDEPAAYHFYFGRGSGTPGTLLTFFPWVSGRRGQPGTGQIAGVALSVSPDSLQDWKKRAREAGVTCQGPETRFGEESLTVLDPDGIAITLVGAGEPGMLQSVTLCESDAGLTGAFLREVLGMTSAGDDGHTTRYQMGSGNGHIEILHAPDIPRGKMASGIVHHVALTVADEAGQMEWREKLVRFGVRVSPVRDRLYFHSIYFREPGGVLFEIATAGPGFLIDESEDRLGERLSLPPWLEPVRESIERRLPTVENLCPSNLNS